MPTFFDPIEIDDVDIEDSAASFYLIELPKGGGFKICGTTQNLNSHDMKFDPETRVESYWPVSLKHLQAALLQHYLACFQQADLDNF